MFLVKSVKYSDILRANILQQPFLIINSPKFSTKMAKPSIYITRELNNEAIKLAKESCDVSMWTGPDPVPRNVLLQNIQNKDGLLCLLTDKIDKEVLDKAGPNLKVISTMSVGFDHLSIVDIKTRNIKIGYTPDILTDATAELTVGLLLSTSRRLIEASNEAKNGGWSSWAPYWMCGPGLSGSTVGIVGFGRIGQKVMGLLKPFNVAKFLYTSRNPKDVIDAKHVTLDSLLTDSDFVIATCALTAETKEMFNDEAFKKMKKTAVFINSSRGGVVDQDALVRALKSNEIFAAGLDVTTPEPLPTSHELFNLKNCVVLPHIGSASLETRKNMADMAVRNLIAGLKGEKMPAEL